MATTPERRKRSATIEINGYALKAIREKSGIEQHRFAEEAGISPGYLSNLERGARVRVSPAIFAALLRVLLIEDRRALLSNPHTSPTSTDAEHPALIPATPHPDTTTARGQTGPRSLAVSPTHARTETQPAHETETPNPDGRVLAMLHQLVTSAYGQAMRQAGLPTERADEIHQRVCDLLTDFSDGNDPGLTAT